MLHNMISIQDLDPRYVVVGGGTIFKGGGANFGRQKGRVSACRRASATQGGIWGWMCPPSEVGAFFENVVLNEAIWCTIFHHVKRLTARLLGVSFNLEQDGQKVEGAMPPGLKSGGATGPRSRPRPRPAVLPAYVVGNKFLDVIFLVAVVIVILLSLMMLLLSQLSLSLLMSIILSLFSKTHHGGFYFILFL